MRPPCLLALALTALLAACGDADQPPTYLPVAGGEPERGRSLIYAYGCGTCHQITGIRGARGAVGPALDDYAQRSLLAGIVPNTPRALVSWLIDPVALAPQTGMPNMGITEPEARHIAAYLYTLGASRTRVYPNDPPLKLQGRENPVLQAGGNPVSGPDSADTTLRRPALERGLDPRSSGARRD